MIKRTKEGNQDPDFTVRPSMLTGKIRPLFSEICDSVPLAGTKGDLVKPDKIHIRFVLMY